MLALLAIPARVWIILALVAGLIGSHFIAYRKGISHERNANAVAQAAANEQAREVERSRQRGRDAAVDAGAAREVQLRADADRARAGADGLRGAVAAAEQAAGESSAAAVNATRALGIVVDECSRFAVEVAAAADAATSEARTLRDAWPK